MSEPSDLPCLRCLQLMSIPAHSGDTVGMNSPKSWFRFTLTTVSFLACSSFPPFLCLICFSPPLPFLFLKWKLEVCWNLKCTVIRVALLRKDFTSRWSVHWVFGTFLSQKQDCERLFESWCRITVGRESRLFGLWTESLQWPIHVNVNCDHLSGLGQPFRKQGETPSTKLFSWMTLTMHLIARPLGSSLYFFQG